MIVASTFPIQSFAVSVVCPFTTKEDTCVPVDRNLNHILRRDHQKNSYERRACESVDEKSLS